jgi:hypothetical protein
MRHMFTFDEDFPCFVRLMMICFEIKRQVPEPGVLIDIYQHGNCEQASFEFEAVEITMPDSQVRILNRIVDASKTAWFSVRQASSVLLSERGLYRNRLLRTCDRSLVKSASRAELNVMKKASVIGQRTSQASLVMAEGLREALQRLEVPSVTADCIFAESAAVAVWSSPFLFVCPG